MANATLSKDEILEAIGNMSVFELAELIEAFKSKFNVTIAAAPVGGAAPAAGGGGDRHVELALESVDQLGELEEAHVPDGFEDLVLAQRCVSHFLVPLLMIPGNPGDC